MISKYENLQKTIVNFMYLCVFFYCCCCCQYMNFFLFIRLCNLCFLRNTLRKIPRVTTDYHFFFFLLLLLLFFTEFQLMASASNNTSLSSDQNINQFLVQAGIELQITYCEIIYGLELLIAPLLRIAVFSFLTSIFQSQTQVFLKNPNFNCI